MSRRLLNILFRSCSSTTASKCSEIIQFFECFYFRRQEELEARTKTGSKPSMVLSKMTSISISIQPPSYIFRFLFQNYKIIRKFMISIFRIMNFWIAFLSPTSLLSVPPPSPEFACGCTFPNSPNLKSEKYECCY